MKVNIKIYDNHRVISNVKNADMSNEQVAVLLRKIADEVDVPVTRAITGY